MTSAQINNGNKAPVEALADKALAKKATPNTPRPGTPVLARPEKNAPKANNVHCHSVKFTRANDAGGLAGLATPLARQRERF